MASRASQEGTIENFIAQFLLKTTKSNKVVMFCRYIRLLAMPPYPRFFAERNFEWTISKIKRLGLLSCTAKPARVSGRNVFETIFGQFHAVFWLNTTVLATIAIYVPFSKDTGDQLLMFQLIWCFSTPSWFLAKVNGICQKTTGVAKVSGPLFVQPLKLQND